MSSVPVGGSWEPSASAAKSRRGWWKLIVPVALGAAGTWWALTPGPVVVETGVSDAVVHHAPAATDKELRGAAAIERCRDLLVAAERKLAAFPAMSGVFQKQERIDGELLPLHVMDVKVRREPFAVYMKWQKPDAGQEVIWREGAFDGKILVSPAGWRRKIVPTVKIDPLGDTAMATSKRPIMNMGIWKFNTRLQESFENELTRDPAVEVVMSDGDEIDGRPCHCFRFEIGQPSSLVQFQKMLIYFDRELEIPVACELYRWSDAGGKPTGHLEESYLFRNLKLDAAISDADFDDHNPAYMFTAK